MVRPVFATGKLRANRRSRSTTAEFDTFGNVQPNPIVTDIHR